MTHEKSVTDLVTVEVTNGLLRANVIQGLLQSAGIPVMLSFEAIDRIIGITGTVEIKVPEEWEQEARDLLNAEPRSGEIFRVPPDVTEDDPTP